MGANLSVHQQMNGLRRCSLHIQRRQWHPIPVLLPGGSHGWRSLEGCSPWGHWGLDTTERLHFTFHFHALEKEMATHSSVLAWRIPGKGGAWWAATYGVAQSRTRLKRLSSSSCMPFGLQRVLKAKNHTCTFPKRKATILSMSYFSGINLFRLSSTCQSVILLVEYVISSSAFLMWYCFPEMYRGNV